MPERSAHQISAFHNDLRYLLIAYDFADNACLALVFSSCYDNLVTSQNLPLILGEHGLDGPLVDAHSISRGSTSRPERESKKLARMFTTMQLSQLSSGQTSSNEREVPSLLCVQLFRTALLC